MEMIQVANPGADVAAIRSRLVEAADQVISRGSYILGKEVEQFEERFAGRLGVLGAVWVASGTDALTLGLLALGVLPGDEVVTVSHTAGAMVASILMIGAIPVLVDVEPETYCLDPTKLEKAVGPRTRAIIAVHLYGHPAGMGA